MHPMRTTSRAGRAASDATGASGELDELDDLVPRRLVLSYRLARHGRTPGDVDPVNPVGDGDLTLAAGAVRAVHCDVRAGEHQLGNDDLEVMYAWDGEVLVVRVEPHAPLVLDSMSVAFPHAFAPDERVLMNGYQSWTDTCELAPDARMRGLRGVPDGIVRRYALDGGGDYRFVAYSNARGELHGFTYATLRRAGRVTLLGSLDESDGFTLVKADAAAGRVWVERETPLRALPAGEAVCVCRLAVTHGDAADAAATGEGGAPDGAPDGGAAASQTTPDAAAAATARAYRRWFELMGTRAREARPLVGYMSWYRHYAAIDEQTLLHDLDGTARVLDEMGGLLEGLGATFQIDDGYAKVGDWLTPDPAAFPRGMAPLAAAARARGLVPGIWVAPFVCERASRLAAEHPDWLLRDEVGDPVTTGCQWSGGLALDTRVPAVRDYVTHVLRVMTGRDGDGWGFSLLKCDFLYGACMLPHDGMNRGQLMADALGLIRDAVGDDVAILACGVPLGSAFGRVEYCRVGCDVGLDWDDKPHMRLLHRERTSTRLSLADTIARAPLDGRAFGNDPDVIFVRDDVKLTRQQRVRLARADARLGSVLLTSDDMGAWSAAQRDEYRGYLATFGARARAAGHAHAHEHAHEHEGEHAHGCACGHAHAHEGDHEPDAGRGEL